MNRQFIAGFALACLVLVITGSVPAAANDDTLFTVVRNSTPPEQDVLVVIDPENGDKQIVGDFPFAPGEGDPDLVIIDGVIWATVADRSNPIQPESWFGHLLAVNPGTGAELCRHRITVGMDDTLNVESIAFLNGELYVGFHQSPENIAPKVHETRRIGVISPTTGEIGDPCDLPSVPGTVQDLDGLGTHPSENQLRSVDIDDPSIVTDLFRVLPCTAYQRQHQDFPGGFNDIVYTSEALITAYATDHYNDQIVTITETAQGFVVTNRIAAGHLFGIAVMGPENTFFASRVDKSGTDALIFWNDASTATEYDVVRGDLETLRSTGGDFEAATQACVAENFMGTHVTDSDTLEDGQGFWYLVRPRPCGTYDSGLPFSQVASRDPGVDASPLSCVP